MQCYFQLFWWRIALNLRENSCRSCSPYLIFQFCKNYLWFSIWQPTFFLQPVQWNVNQKINLFMVWLSNKCIWWSHKTIHHHNKCLILQLWENYISHFILFAKSVSEEYHILSFHNSFNLVEEQGPDKMIWVCICMYIEYWHHIRFFAPTIGLYDWERSLDVLFSMQWFWCKN